MPVHFQADVCTMAQRAVHPRQGSVAHGNFCATPSTAERTWQTSRQPGERLKRWFRLGVRPLQVLECVGSRVSAAVWSLAGLQTVALRRNGRAVGVYIQAHCTHIRRLRARTCRVRPQCRRPDRCLTILRAWGWGDCFRGVQSGLSFPIMRGA